MAQQARASFSRWLGRTILLAGGGAVFVYLTLWLTRGLHELLGSGQLVRDEGLSFGLISASAGLIGLGWLLLLRPLLGWSWRRGLVVTIGWLICFFLFWALSLAIKGISLPLFGAGWLLLGALGGLLGDRGAPRRPTRSSQPASLGRPIAGQPLVRTDQFGRVPPATVTLMNVQVQLARTRIVSALPVGTSQPLRSFTAAAVLQRTLQDWWQHGNNGGLTDQDVSDLRSFVALAAEMARSHGFSDPIGQAIYRATLGALLDDWLAHWNTDGQSGPPRR